MSETLISDASPRIALVTGAGSGIGRATTLTLLRAGWTVVLTGRRVERLHGVIAEAQAVQPDADLAARTLAVAADVTDEASVLALFDAIRARFGRLDMLFNNAGLFTPAAPVEDVSLENWKLSVDTNLTGVFLCTREAFRLMKAQSPQGGRIINNGSISAHVPRPWAIGYTATKHAITGLTKAASLDGRRWNIAVGQIDVGNALTELAARMAKGVPQANGEIAVEPMMDVDQVGQAVLHMANLPLEVNVLFHTVMATKMPFVGRG